MNKQVELVYVSRTDKLHVDTRVHRLAATHIYTRTHTTYQLTVGVNCVGPQGKNNIAPKDTENVLSLRSLLLAATTKIKPVLLR